MQNDVVYLMNVFIGFNYMDRYWWYIFDCTSFCFWNIKYQIKKKLGGRVEGKGEINEESSMDAYTVTHVNR